MNKVFLRFPASEYRAQIERKSACPSGTLSVDSDRITKKRRPEEPSLTDDASPSKFKEGFGGSDGY
jgi:hypothetical protein